MPPFKDAQEKKEYILAHAHLFDALGIKLTDKKIEELVNDESKYEEYYKAKESIDKEKAIKNDITENDILGPRAEIRKADINRLPDIFYDDRDTPEARKWNADLKEMLNSPNAPKKLAEMCIKLALNFDDNAMRDLASGRKALTAQERAVNFFFVSNDLLTKLPFIFDMNNPMEAAFVRAAQDKFIIFQGLKHLGADKIYKASRISLILPELDREQTNKLMVAQTEAPRTPYRQETAEALSHYSAFKDNEFLLQQDMESCKPLFEMGLMGDKESIYKRAYKETPEGKKYLSRQELSKMIKNGESIEDVKVEEVSAADRDYIDNMMRSSKTPGVKPLWESKEEKKAYLETLRPALAEVGYVLTDEKINQILNDDSLDELVLQNRELHENLSGIPRDEQGFALPEDPGVAKAEHLVGALIIKGDTPEIREWNDKVALLSQSKEGMQQLTRLAAKRLLSVDISSLAEMDQDKRIQYLAEHPVERNLFGISESIRDAYVDTLKPEEKENNEIVKALEGRKIAFEDVDSDFTHLKANGDRLFSVLPDLKPEQIVKLKESAIPTHSKKATDPKAKAFFNEASNAVGNRVNYQNSAIDSKVRETINELYSTGKINNDSFTQRITTTEEVVDSTAKVTSTKETEYTFEQMVKAIAEGKVPAEKFVFHPNEKNKTAVDKFLAETSDTPVITASKEEMEQIRKNKQHITLNGKNLSAINGLVNQLTDEASAKDDPEFKKLCEAAALCNTNGKRDSALKEAFNYVNEHRAYTKDPIAQKKFNVALMTVAALDKERAEALVAGINHERKYDGLFAKPQIDYKTLLKEAGVVPSTMKDNGVYNYRDPFDKRMHNIKEIYKHLKDDLDPFYHKNSPEFKAMLQSMKNVMDYGYTAKDADPKVIESMLKDVLETSKTYLKDRAPLNYLGKNRNVAALAAVAALDPKEGEAILSKVCAEKRQWANQLCQVVAKKRDTITTRDVLNREKLINTLSKDEILAKMEKDVNATHKMVRDKSLSYAERGERMTEYIVKKRIFNALKGDTIYSKEILAELSKSIVTEASNKLAKDDVYRQVVNAMKSRIDTPIDQQIDKIESEYMKRETEMVKAKEEKEQAEASKGSASKSAENTAQKQQEAPKMSR